MAAFDSPRPPAGRASAGTISIPSLSVIGATTLVVAAALLPVVQSSSATTTSYEMRRLERHKAELQASMLSAESEIAELGSLARIDREARERLGMVPAGRTMVVRVDQPAPPGPRVPARYLSPDEPAAARQPESGFTAFLSRLVFFR